MKQLQSKEEAEVQVPMPDKSGSAIGKIDSGNLNFWTKRGAAVRIMPHAGAVVPNSDIPTQRSATSDEIRGDVVLSRGRAFSRNASSPCATSCRRFALLL